MSCACQRYNKRRCENDDDDDDDDDGDGDGDDV